MKVEGNIVDVVNETIYPGSIFVKNGKIAGIKPLEKRFRNFILPGLIDAHIHIESSMLSPSRFAEAVIPFGTTAVITDPHEIANVMGVAGISFIRKEAKLTPLKVYFTAPSCVPATVFETSGAVINSKEIGKLLARKDIAALGEMMNYPGVIFKDKEVLKKVDIAKKYRKPIDGHCPGVSGSALKKYIAAGITTDHESTTLKEAKEKAALGMKIMIREGSTAKNIKNLIGLAKISKYECFLVSDDKHPEDLRKGHINLLLKKAVSRGIKPIKAIQMATLNPKRHYGLQTGLLQVNDKADFIEVDNLRNFKVLRVWIDGKLAAKSGEALFKATPLKIRHSFKIKNKFPGDFVISASKDASVRVIKVIKNQITTGEITVKLKAVNGDLAADAKRDILKIAVCSRYGNNNIGLGFIKGFGIKKGAIASSIAHDSHNIIAAGANNGDMARAVNLVAKNGGLVALWKDKIVQLELPLAGLMSEESAENVCKRLKKIHHFVKKMGGKLENPFMTLSFMALLVVPKLKLSDKGLFDAEKFKFTNLIVS